MSVLGTIWNSTNFTMASSAGPQTQHSLEENTSDE
jgi:hypothetical protein